MKKSLTDRFGSIDRTFEWFKISFLHSTSRISSRTRQTFLLQWVRVVLDEVFAGQQDLATTRVKGNIVITWLVDIHSGWGHRGTHPASLMVFILPLSPPLYMKKKRSASCLPYELKGEEPRCRKLPETYGGIQISLKIYYFASSLCMTKVYYVRKIAFNVFS